MLSILYIRCRRPGPRENINRERKTKGRQYAGWLTGRIRSNPHKSPNKKEKRVGKSLLHNISLRCRLSLHEPPIILLFFCLATLGNRPIRQQESETTDEVPSFLSGQRDCCLSWDLCVCSRLLILLNWGTTLWLY